MAKLFSAVFAFSPKKSVLVLEILFLSAEKNEKAEKNSGSRGDRLRAFIRRIFSRNFPVFNALAAVLCFIVVPGLIIHKSMDAVLDRMVADRHEKLSSRLEERLDRLEFFVQNEQFAHFLLSGLCKTSTGEPQAFASVRSKLARLKAMFPGAFSFVIADASGRPLENHSDLSGFNYLFRQAFQLTAELEKASIEGLGHEAILDLETRLKRLKPLLGTLLRPEDLLIPFRPQRSGRSILVSAGEEKFHLWYGSGSDFRLLCFVSRSFIRGNDGLQWAVKALNRTDPDTITGFAPYPPENDDLVPALSEKKAAEVVMALARHEELGFYAPEKAESAIACRFLNNRWRGFCFWADGRSADAAEMRNVSLAFLAKIILIAGFIILVYQLRHPISLTVKLKVSVFFVYAVFMPLLAISSLTMQYVAHSEAEILNDLKSQLQHAIEKVDADYQWFLRQIADKTTAYLSSTIMKRPEMLEDHAALVRFNDDLRQKVWHDEILLIDLSSRDYLQNISQKVSRSRGVMKSACVEALKIITGKHISGAREKFSPLAFHLAQDLHIKQNKITYLGIGDFEVGAYYRLMLPDGRKMEESMIGVLIWEFGRLHHRYAREKIAALDKGADVSFAVLARSDGRFVLAPPGADENLLRLMKVSINRQTVQAGQVRLNNRNFVVVAMPGKNLNRLILAAMIPAETVKAHAEIIMFKASLFATLLLIIAVAGVFLLQKWIFRPLSAIREGIEAIGRRDFNARLPQISNNELGRLVAAFNHSLENLQELAVAGVVQESLVSEPFLSCDRIEAAAFSRTMTELGGDFFYFSKTEGKKVLAFIGDATGHGIPAALSMAMARAVMLFEEGQGAVTGPGLMERFNSVFCSLRTQGSKDFMTALCAVVDAETGEAELINAGHPFPMLLRAGADRAELLSEICGLPPGFDRRRVFTPAKIRLFPGDRLILFTDGFVESVSRDGRQIGFQDLAKLVAESARGSLRAHIEQVFVTIEKRVEKAQDDCTMLMLRYM